MASKRNVKLGRKMLAGPLAQHWAVAVGDTWYEIEGAGKKSTNTPNKVKTSSIPIPGIQGFHAQSGAGMWGGDLAGETERTDSEIQKWINDWLSKNPCYGFTTANCQKFALEFMKWLTKGKFICNHRTDAASTFTTQVNDEIKLSDGRGNTIKKIGFGSAYTNPSIGSGGHDSNGIPGLQVSAPNIQLQTVAGPNAPGFGAFIGAELGKVEGSLGNVIGGHVGLNLNTGVGVRNGNAEIHLLGFGGKVGDDGLEVNTPIGGLNLCSIM